ncbi:MAG: hypothetical protein IJ181_04885 [Acidaminococcaceae bacterium]|nr:hypothetical protein [Acidaminococcaceae bacterium]
MLPVCYPWGWEVAGTPCLRAFREGFNIGGVVNPCVSRGQESAAGRGVRRED